MEIVQFNTFEMELPKQLLKDCYHSGECYDDCEYWADKVKDAFNHVTDKQIISELSEFGAWEREDLKDRKENIIKILWIAAGDFQEGKF